MQASTVSPSVEERDQVLCLLRGRAPQLKQRGIRHLGLFGSMPRGEAGHESDVDLLLDFDPRAGLGVGVVSLKEELTQLLRRPVGLAFMGRLHPSLRAEVKRDHAEVF
jgi:predicted nucleotidyltransferase